MAYCGPSGNGIGPSFPYMGNHHTEMLDLQRHGVGAIIVPQFFSSAWWGDASPHPPWIRHCESLCNYDISVIQPAWNLAWP